MRNNIREDVASKPTLPDSAEKEMARQVVAQICLLLLVCGYCSKASSYTVQWEWTIAFQNSAYCTSPATVYRTKDAAVRALPVVCPNNKLEYMTDLGPQSLDSNFVQYKYGWPE